MHGSLSVNSNFSKVEDMAQDDSARQAGRFRAAAVHIAGAEGIDVSPAVYDNRYAFVEASRRGLPGTVVKQAVDALGHRELFVRLLGTTAGNLNRFYRRRALAPAQSEALLDVLRVFVRAASVFGSRERGNEWLMAQVPALGGERPVDLCDTFEGRALVREALHKIECGEFP